MTAQDFTQQESTNPTDQRGLLVALGGQFIAFGLILGVQGVIWLEVTKELGLGEGVFGTAMLALPLIGLVMLAMNGQIYGALGGRRQAVLGLAGLGAGMVVLGTTNGLAGFIVALLLAGIGFATLDASTNSSGVDFEQMSGRHVLNTLHGLQSGAVIVGALLTGFALQAGWNYQLIAILSAAVFCIPPVLATLPAPYPPSGAAEEMPTGDEAGSLLRQRGIAALAAICFLGSAAEAIATVWTVIYMSQIGASVALAGVTFSLFNAAMFIGRFANQPLVSTLGPRASLLTSGLGIILATVPLLLTDGVVPAVLGFTVLGFGVAGIQPTSLSAAGPLASNTGAVTAVIMMSAYGALLIAPTGFGWFAELASTRTAISLVTGAGVLSVALALRYIGRPAAAAAG